MASNKWKYKGNLLFFVGLTLVIIGLSTYINGPKENGTLTLECVYDIHKIDKLESGNKFFYFSCDDIPKFINISSYTLMAPKLVSDREIKVVSTNESGTLYLYSMNITEYLYLYNSTKFIQWFHSKRLAHSEEIIDLNESFSDVTFKPFDNGSYYDNGSIYVFIFKNYTDDTEMQVPSVNIREFFTIKRFDFNKTWTGFFMSIFGSLLILVGSFIENPIDKIIVKICSLTKPLNSSNYRTNKDFFMRKRLFIWKWMLGIASFWFLIPIYFLFDILFSDIPLDIKFLLQDQIIRISLYMFSPILLIIFIQIVFVEIAYPISVDVFQWFIKNRGFDYNLMVEKKSFEILLRGLRSYKSISIYLITVVLICFNLLFHDNLSLLLFSLIPLIIFISYIFVNSYKKACDIYGFDFIIEMHHIKFSIVKSAVIGIWIFVAAIFFLSYGIIFLQPLIFYKIIDSSTASTFVSAFPVPTILLDATDVGYVFLSSLYSIIIILAFFVFCIILCINYLTISPSMRKEKATNNLKEMMIFVSVFTSIQIISAVSTSDVLDIKTILTTSLMISIISYFLMYSYRQLVFIKPKND